MTVTISPDDRNVYIAGRTGAVAVLDRATDGSLTQKPGSVGCVSNTGTNQCAKGIGMPDLVVATAVSPDGKSVYVGSNGAISVFTRAANGTITQRSGSAACISDAATGPCYFRNGALERWFLILSQSGAYGVLVPEYVSHEERLRAAQQAERDAAAAKQRSKIAARSDALAALRDLKG